MEKNIEIGNNILDCCAENEITKLETKYLLNLKENLINPLMFIYVHGLKQAERTFINFKIPYE